MTPKEKAQELILKYLKIKNNNEWWSKVPAKECALIAVDEAIDQWEYIDIYISNLGGELNTNLKYWYEVKEEIIKL